MRELALSEATKLQVRVLLDELQCDWSAPKDEIEESILEEYAQRGRQYTRFLIIYIYTLTVTFLLSPLVPCSLDILVPLNKSRLLDHPLVMDYLVDQKRYFYLSFVRTYACVFVGMTVTIAVDGTFITIVLHICSLLQILSTKLQRMYDEFNKGVCDVNANYLLFRKMARAVMYHQRILRYVYLVNVVYAKSYLAQLFIVIVILSVILYCLFLAITVTKNIDEIILYGAHTIGLSCIVFLNVLPGQEMLDHSSDLFRNAYNGYWHVAPLSSQKLLLMIMQRSMKPCVITATNVLSSSYETFGVIVQTSLSYFTVLCSVR
ncbi:hypothetical protein KM043_014011 [Ampulex compressa]|nr:hypothetical protein KM043_014011 [Ampulex compressa]